jgi:anthranilate phosphoribosyltransferase
MFEIEPKDFGFERRSLEGLGGGDAEANAAIIRSVLSGARRDEARTLVVVNAAAALHVGGLAGDLRAAARLAEQSIDGGAAQMKLEQLRQASGEAI